MPPTGFPLDEALKAQTALRDAAGLPPELFPIQAFVGMISDEIEALRSKGVDDDGIAAIICDHSAIQITSQQIRDHYAPPEFRHPLE
ncbi:MAG: hypothetical protein NVSMB3_00100 [Acidobacteriaceae bacterium]